MPVCDRNPSCRLQILWLMVAVHSTLVKSSLATSYAVLAVCKFPSFGTTAK